MLTFNVLALKHAAGRERSEVVRRQAELRPDVVALQEVTRTPDVDQGGGAGF